jgi:hypothetical protein
MEAVKRMEIPLAFGSSPDAGMKDPVPNGATPTERSVMH